MTRISPCAGEAAQASASPKPPIIPPLPTEKFAKIGLQTLVVCRFDTGPTFIDTDGPMLSSTLSVKSANDQCLESYVCKFPLPTTPIPPQNLTAMKDSAAADVVDAQGKVDATPALTDSLLPELGDPDPCEEEPDNGMLSCLLLPQPPKSSTKTNPVKEYQHEQPVYFPEELVGNWLSFSGLGLYYCYKISFEGFSKSTASPTDIILAVKCDMGSEFISSSFKIGSAQGYIKVTMEYVGIIHLNHEQVIIARRFQTTILSLLISNDHSEVSNAIKYSHEVQVSLGVVYLLLPLVSGKVDWSSINFSASPVYETTDKDMRHYHSCKDVNLLQTKDGPLCRCILQNSVVYAPHNRIFYVASGFLDLNGNFLLHRSDGSVVSYKTHFNTRDGPDLTCENQPLLVVNKLFKVHNFLRKGHRKGKELPPELCRLVMSPVSANILRSFSFIPSVMSRIQCMLLSVRLKVQLGPRMQQFSIPALKILEALTTKECQEEFSQKSLATLGDSFLKYVTTQHLFSKYKLHHEGMLAPMKNNLVSNTTLCQLACNNNLVGYIRGEEFNPQNWIIPGLGYDIRGDSKDFCRSANDMYILKKISIKSKRIADTVEALIGAYLSAAGEQAKNEAALLFIISLGMDIEFHTEMPDERKITTKPEEFIDVRSLEILLGYVFNDPALLMEALTHDSYQIAGMTACYQRLEFLGDAVLDYIFTAYHFNQYYPECTPALLTDLRSASVNNYCYAHAAVKAGLHKHILHSSSEQMIYDLENSGRSFSGPSHGWEPGIGLHENLSDVIESIAGAIYLDSEHDKEVVWRSMRRLLYPLATAKTVVPDPVRKLKELCEKRHYCKPSYTSTREDGVTTVVAEVWVKGTARAAVGTGRKKEVAKKYAANALLKDLTAAVP